jgi:hypothetical protein
MGLLLSAAQFTSLAADRDARSQWHENAHAATSAVKVTYERVAGRSEGNCSGPGKICRHKKKPEYTALRMKCTSIV